MGGAKSVQSPSSNVRLTNQSGVMMSSMQNLVLLLQEMLARKYQEMKQEMIGNMRKYEEI